MPPENDNEQTPNNDEISAQEYIRIIAEMKQNSVSKEDYEKLRQEKADILKAFVNGEQLPEGSKPPEETIKELRKDLFAGDHNLTNLEFVQKSLQLRKQIIENGGTDPFLPVGYNITPSEEDVRAAARVAQVMQDCIDYAQGDPQAFTNELQRRTVDTAPMRKAK